MASRPRKPKSKYPMQMESKYVTNNFFNLCNKIILNDRVLSIYTKIKVLSCHLSVPILSLDYCRHLHDILLFNVKLNSCVNKTNSTWRVCSKFH